MWFPTASPCAVSRNPQRKYVRGYSTSDQPGHGRSTPPCSESHNRASAISTSAVAQRLGVRGGGGIAPLFISEVALPNVIIEYVWCDSLSPTFECNRPIRPRSICDLRRTTSIGRIQLPGDKLGFGSQVPSAKIQGGVPSLARNLVVVDPHNNRWGMPKESLTLLSTRYQVYPRRPCIPDGTSLPHIRSSARYLFLYPQQRNMTSVGIILLVNRLWGTFGV